MHRPASVEAARMPACQAFATRHTRLRRNRTRAARGLGLSDKLGDSRPADAASSTGLRGHTGAFDGRAQTSLARMEEVRGSNPLNSTL